MHRILSVELKDVPCTKMITHDRLINGRQRVNYAIALN